MVLIDLTQFLLFYTMICYKTAAKDVKSFNMHLLYTSKAIINAIKHSVTYVSLILIDVTWLQFKIKRHRGAV